ncbi:S-adenosyl-L-methionine-dependent methyltransferase [Gymnopus androsaceus JB14]|uniref:S-adenosyl-L-methionine-dependent methyltransferase n=1 Tax=Gymnopus androsaceus JB14 TaxID=1447944 RepID=A0A6A4II46_9AGAR|nr:S-adenosyl-L-methionine-dependent methyltransferase [Gymnopus androsaceus JB14]
MSQHTDVAFIGEDDSEYFRRLFNRTFNSLNPTYLLPSDEDEVKRSELHHRMMQFVFQGNNYVGEVKKALQFGQQRRVLDLGTGCGLWAINMADEFPRAEVIGIDLAPLQPRTVPPNCTFELCDLETGIPYPDGYFDLVHARSMHIGIRDYPQLLQEAIRVLRPGGLIILIEPDLIPIVDGSRITRAPAGVGAADWSTFWETYRSCLTRQGIDITVPQRLTEMLNATGAFENVITRDGNIPVGFWPKGKWTFIDPHLLSVGQLQWLDYDLFLPALRPMFLFHGLTENQVQSLITGAQRDLYHPVAPLSAHINIVHASKQL